MNRLLRLAWIGMSCAAMVWAHHSAAAYDTGKTATLKGTVETFNWVNPHVNFILVVDAKDKEAAQNWRIETSSPSNLTRAGWSQRSLNPGDKIEVNFSPMRDGSPAGLLKSVTLPDGKVLSFSFTELEKPGIK